MPQYYPFGLFLHGKQFLLLFHKVPRFSQRLDAVLTSLLLLLRRKLFLPGVITLVSRFFFTIIFHMVNLFKLVDHRLGDPYLAALFAYESRHIFYYI